MSLKDVAPVRPKSFPLRQNPQTLSSYIQPVVIRPITSPRPRIPVIEQVPSSSVLKPLPKIEIPEPAKPKKKKPRAVVRKETDSQDSDNHLRQNAEMKRRRSCTDDDKEYWYWFQKTENGLSKRTNELHRRAKKTAKIEPIVEQVIESSPKPDAIDEFDWGSSSVNSPSEYPPRNNDFDFESFNVGDCILVDRTEVGDGLRKAIIRAVNRDYSENSRLFRGEIIVLKPAARIRSQQNPEKRQTVYYVHYARLDRRMDEWIDVHEVHSAVEKEPTPIEAKPLILTDSPNKKTRSQKKKAEEFQHNEKAPVDFGATIARCEEVHEESTMVKNIETVEIGLNVIRCWYFSPYPLELLSSRQHLYICEYCMFYFCNPDIYQVHKKIGCDLDRPPGELIYEGGTFAVYEVVGVNHPLYCESLCLLSKLFLDHKTLYYQCDTFYFYVLCEIEPDGTHHFVGHFSKENFSINNLACIMVLPPFQRKGYGKFLIQLSYALSCREGYIGMPEKPLSDLGKVSYRGFWWWLLVNTIEAAEVEEDILVDELSRMSGVHPDDIFSTFESMALTKKYKGENYVTMNPNILMFCKSLPLFKSPRLMLDVDKIRLTARYLPVHDTENDGSETGDADYACCLLGLTA